MSLNLWCAALRKGIGVLTPDEYTNKIINTDALSFLRSLPSESVNCCVTSPPYFGIRDYLTGTWIGGDPECNHTTSRAVVDNMNKPVVGLRSPGGDGFTCVECGANREDKQLGLEASPLEYVQNMTAVFSEFKRVLRKDGTLFLNLGDSYWASSMTGGNDSHNAQGGESGYGIQRQFQKGKQINDFNLTPKSLIGSPWRVAFAMQDAGWCLRTDIVWEKPNVMPESVRDRVTRSHEFVFMFVKSWDKTMWVHRDKGLEKRVYEKPDPDYVWINRESKQEIQMDPRDPKAWYRKNLWRGFDYYYDADAIKEPIADSSKQRIAQATFDQQKGGPKDYGLTGINPNRSARKAVENFAANNDGMRNRRSVFTINTKPYLPAHFAVMPQELVRTCILAGCPTDGIVLDMFMGSGTVAQVARELDRRYTGCELNSEYIELIDQRLSVPLARKLL